MKQVWIIATGGPENLQLRETPDLQPQAGELRIRARAPNGRACGGKMKVAERFANAPP